MGLRWRLLVFGYPALEILTAWGLASGIGWGWTLAILLAGLPVGLLLMRGAGRSAMAELQAAAASGTNPASIGRHGGRLAAGFLLAVPGVWSDLAAVAVLIPGSRRWMLQRTGLIRGSLLWSRGQGRYLNPEFLDGEVVQGDVLRSRPAGPSGDGPTGVQDRRLPG